MSNLKLKKSYDFLNKNIVENVNSLINQKSSSIQEIEKTVGRDNLRFLILGKNKAPSINTIFLISQKLEVTIEDLIKEPNLDHKKIEYKQSGFNDLAETVKTILSDIQKINLDSLIKNLVCNIQFFLNKTSISIYEIEKSIGQNNLRDLLNGIRKTTSISTVYQISRKLGVTIEELIQTPINSDQKNINKDLESNLVNIEEKTKALLIDIQKLKKDF